MKKALVLSGGSIKGAFQAGALEALLRSEKFIPDVIYGTSVGSLNGAFIADRAGQVPQKKDINWPGIGTALERFWIDNITSFKALGKKRCPVSLFFSILCKNSFVSMLNMDRMYDLIRREVDPANLKNSPAKFYACATDLVEGKVEYASANDGDPIVDYIIASTAIPIVQPICMIGGKPFLDGGIREVVPLARAIHDGAEKIVVIVCHPDEIKTETFQHRNLLALMSRNMDIFTSETVKNDLHHCDQITQILEQNPGPHSEKPLDDKREIKLLTIRPDKTIEIELEDFDEKQIRTAFKDGQRIAKRAIQACQWLQKDEPE